MTPTIKTMMPIVQMMAILAMEPIISRIRPRISKGLS